MPRGSAKLCRCRATPTANVCDIVGDVLTSGCSSQQGLLTTEVAGRRDAGAAAVRHSVATTSAGVALRVWSCQYRAANPLFKRYDSGHAVVTVHLRSGRSALQSSCELPAQLHLESACCDLALLPC